MREEDLLCQQFNGLKLALNPFSREMSAEGTVDLKGWWEGGASRAGVTALAVCVAVAAG